MHFGFDNVDKAMKPPAQVLDRVVGARKTSGRDTIPRIFVKGHEAIPDPLGDLLKQIDSTRLRWLCFVQAPVHSVIVHSKLEDGSFQVRRPQAFSWGTMMVDPFEDIGSKLIWQFVRVKGR